MLIAGPMRGEQRRKCEIMIAGIRVAFAKQSPSQSVAPSGAIRTSRSPPRSTIARKGDLVSLSCGDVPVFSPGPQDKRWREKSFQGKPTACAS
jgi:hypothetical protein